MKDATKTANKILKAAKECFAERGYAATTTRAIAEAAGVNEVTVFRHFKSKEGILRALAARIAARQAGPASLQLPASAGARETLRALAAMEIETAMEDGALAIRLALDANSVPEVSRVVGKTMRTNLDDLAHRIARWQTAGEIRSDVDPTIIAQAFFGLTSSYVMYRIVVGTEEGSAAIDEASAAGALFDMFWTGVVGTVRGETGA